MSKMKWFFGFNAETPWYDNYVRYIKCAVNSCQHNTSLAPCFVYDGQPCELTEWLSKKNVQVIFARSRFYDYFQSLKSDGLSAETASGAFLRLEIPQLIKSNNWNDKFVLYTDCDVLFLKNPALQNQTPEVFACAP